MCIEVNFTERINRLFNYVFHEFCRWHILNGRRVHYRPGWDCHGLPIELKVCISWQLVELISVIRHILSSPGFERGEEEQTERPLHPDEGAGGGAGHGFGHDGCAGE